MKLEPEPDESLYHFGLRLGRIVARGKFITLAFETAQTYRDQDPFMRGFGTALIAREVASGARPALGYELASALVVARARLNDG